jgi:ribosomal protein L44E
MEAPKDMNHYSNYETEDMLRQAVEWLKVEASNARMEASKYDRDGMHEVGNALRIVVSRYEELTNEWNMRNGYGCELCGCENVSGGDICSDCKMVQEHEQVLTLSR